MAPRCFIIRHGETEWSLNGRHTGTTELPLTANGERRIRATGKALVGDDRLIVPKQLSHIYVSPRHRAQRTLELLSIGCNCSWPWSPEKRDCGDAPPRSNAEITVNNDVREWDYGDYEGLTSRTIRAQREANGEGVWDIWRDGCPGGESPGDIEKRLDGVISEIREKFHRPHMEGTAAKDGSCGDVLVLAHGHILRAFAMRWVGKPLTDTALLLEAGGVGTLSYEHNSIDEPAILLGGGFVVGDDVKEAAKDEVRKEIETQKQ